MWARRAGGFLELSRPPSAERFSPGAAPGEGLIVTRPAIPAARPVRDGGRAAAFLAGMLAVSGGVAGDPNSALAPFTDTDARIAAARKTLRDVECARCHGKDYDGLAAPSITEYARTQSREMFVRMVLDGDPPRGMPGYRANVRVEQSIEDIYLYFLARANGTIHAGSPPQPTGPTVDPDHSARRRTP